jgi:glutamine amidotransferase
MPSGKVSLTTMAGDLRTDCVIGVVEEALREDGRKLQADEAGPHRWRQWLFAGTHIFPNGNSAGGGDAGDGGPTLTGARARLLADLPPFLRASLRGDGDSELAFHVFLSFLHDAGMLQVATIPTDAIVAALRGLVGQIEAVAAEFGGGSVGNVLVSDGDRVVAYHGPDQTPEGRSARMILRRWEGEQAAAALVADDFQLRAKVPSPARLHFSLLVADDVSEDDTDARYTPVAPRHVVVLTRDRGDEQRVEPA